MSKERKRISITKLEKATGNDNIVKIPLEGFDGVDIEIIKTISLKDSLEFVENVVSSCVDEESGEYTPQIKEFAIRKEILTKYANFTMPSDIEKQYRLVYANNFAEQVVSHINTEQLGDILKSISKKIEHLLNCIVGTATSNTLKLIEKIDAMSEQSSALFGAIKNVDVHNLFANIDSIANMNEEKVAQAIHETIIDKKEE